MEPLSLALQAGRAKCYGGGYPSIWELAAKDIPDFLTALDNRHYRFMDDYPRDAHELLKRLDIADDEMLLVEAWDQS